MKEELKKILLKSHLLNIVRKFDLYHYLKYKENHQKKQNFLLDLQRKFSLDTLIETGTYLGDMVFAMKSHFKHIFSIELSEDLFKSAEKRFKDEKNITILNGNSLDLLSKILSTIDKPCLFWLDAHYSAGVTAKGETDTPILGELGIILNHRIKTHVIAIDDASSFTGQNGYPTIENLKKFILDKGNNYRVEIIGDIIKIYPAGNIRI
jgi:hypothetical protein